MIISALPFLLFGLWCLLLPASFVRFQKFLVKRYMPVEFPSERVIRAVGAVIIFFTLVELW